MKIERSLFKPLIIKLETKEEIEELEKLICCITDSLYFCGAWITERIISYHQVGHPHTIYGAFENEFYRRFKQAEQKVSDANTE